MNEQEIQRANTKNHRNIVRDTVEDQIYKKMEHMVQALNVGCKKKKVVRIITGSKNKDSFCFCLEN